MQHLNVLSLVVGTLKHDNGRQQKQNGFNALTLLYIYKELTDNIDLVSVGNEFVEKYEERMNIFGKFSKEDLNK